MIVSWKTVEIVNGKNLVVNKELKDVDKIDVGKFGLHAFRDDLNFFIPLDEIKSIHIK